MRLPIYLDHNATTPVDGRVLEAMLPYFREHYGNAGSKTHSFGWTAEKAVDGARRQVAALLGARPAEIVFTSGATESDNLAILGAAASRRGGHIVTARTEHKAVLDPCTHLEKQGFEITRLDPEKDGRYSPAAVEGALRDDTFLVSIMLANNETGSIQDVAGIAEVTRPRGVLLHTDAAQAVGKIPVGVDDLNVDLLSLSGHKMYGPMGVGALYVRGRHDRGKLSSIQFGGGQESGLRPGTLSVPLIVGLGEACAVAEELLPTEAPRLRELADRLLDGLRARLGDVPLNGHPEARLPGTLNVSFPGVESEALLMALPDIALSAGAACTSAQPEPSHVLKALQLGDRRIFSSVRFGIGRSTRVDEIDFAIERVGREVESRRR